jgi:hypothetical protein
VREDGVIASRAEPWRGAARYWSPFRRPESRAELMGFTSAQSYCRR